MLAGHNYDGIPRLNFDQQIRHLHAVDLCVVARGRLICLDLALWRCQGKDIMQRLF